LSHDGVVDIESRFHIENHINGTVILQWGMTLACWIVGWLLGGPEVRIASDQYGNAQRRHLHAARPA
jgi:hypothetical protein